MESNKPIFIGAIGIPRLSNQHHLSRAWKHVNRIWASWGVMPAVIPDPRQYVLVSPKSTSMPSKSTKNTSQPIRSTVMSQISNGQMFQILNYSAEDSPANLSQSQANGLVSWIHEVHSFLKSLGLHRKNSHAFCFLKTSRGFYLTTKATPSALSSIRWMNLGMTCNGKCLTARISASPKTESGCSLSDILEPHPDPKYFLSNKTIRGLMKGQSKPQLLELSKEEVIPGDITRVCQLFGQTSRVHDSKGISPTVPTASGGRHIPMICESADSHQQNVSDFKDSRTAGQKVSPTPNATNALETP